MFARIAVLVLSLVLLPGYGKGNTIREQTDAIVDPIQVETVNDVENNNVDMPSFVTLQGPAGNPPKQCAGIGQSCSTHGDCCTSSCFGVLRTCIPNLGIALNIQIGRSDDS